MPSLSQIRQTPVWKANSACQVFVLPWRIPPGAVTPQSRRARSLRFGRLAFERGGAVIGGSWPRHAVGSQRRQLKRATSHLITWVTRCRHCERTTRCAVPS